MVRTLAPALLGLLAALLFDVSCRRLGLSPPGFREPVRRGLGGLVLAAVLTLGVFQPLAALGMESGPIDFGAIPAWQLFLVHALLVLGLLAWWAAGWLGEPGGSLATQVGWRAAAPLRELAIGVALGVASWVVVVTCLVLTALLAAAVGVEHWLPDRPAAALPWMAGLPLALRATLALSAGVVEETFFRGLLQPRVGLPVSTALFAIAHLSWEQPFMLLGVTLLSVFYGLVARWRQSVLAPIAAHFVFDAIQLLIVIPAVLRELPVSLP